MEHKEPEIIKKSRSGIRKYFYDVFNIRDDMMSYEEIDAMMEENTVIHGANMWILMMAALIASIGLNVNSTAVIIGAMLISPLMSGIITMGFSLAVRDFSLFKKSLIRFGTQVAISLAASTLSAGNTDLGNDRKNQSDTLGCTDCIVRWYRRNDRKY